MRRQTRHDGVGSGASRAKQSESSVLSAIYGIPPRQAEQRLRTNACSLGQSLASSLHIQTVGGRTRSVGCVVNLQISNRPGMKVYRGPVSAVTPIAGHSSRSECCKGARVSACASKKRTRLDQPSNLFDIFLFARCPIFATRDRYSTVQGRCSTVLVSAKTTPSRNSEPGRGVPWKSFSKEGSSCMYFVLDTAKWAARVEWGHTRLHALDWHRRGGKLCSRRGGGRGETRGGCAVNGCTLPGR